MKFNLTLLYTSNEKKTKLIGIFVLIFIKEQHVDLIKEIKKNSSIYTLTLTALLYKNTLLFYFKNVMYNRLKKITSQTNLNMKP